ncbi:hypothetical protein E8E11_009079 [Didymella keratinophila]|nr:hypothetical protein E8E11_009079 [Didymella keratinophila]
MLYLHLAKYKDMFEPAAFFDNVDEWVFGRISQEIDDLLLVLGKDIDSYPVIEASDQALRAKSRQDNEAAAERMIQSNPALCELQVRRACWLGLGHMSSTVGQISYDRAHAELPAIGRHREALMKQAKAKIAQRSAAACSEDTIPIHVEATADQQWHLTPETHEREYEFIERGDCLPFGEDFPQDPELSEEHPIPTNGNGSKEHYLYTPKSPNGTESQSLIDSHSDISSQSYGEPLSKNDDDSLKNLQHAQMLYSRYSNSPDLDIGSTATIPRRNTLSPANFQRIARIFESRQARQNTGPHDSVVSGRTADLTLSSTMLLSTAPTEYQLYLQSCLLQRPLSGLGKLTLGQLRLPWPTKDC